MTTRLLLPTSPALTNIQILIPEMNPIRLNPPTQENQSYVKFLYDSIKEGFPTSEQFIEISGAENNRNNIDPRSTWIDWNGSKLYFDFSEHPLRWNQKALEECDVYFKTCLNRSIAETFLGTSQWEKNKRKIAPFMLFSPDTQAFIKTRKIYKWASKVSKSTDITHIARICLSASNTDGDTENAHYHICQISHEMLNSSGLRTYTKLTGTPGNDVSPVLNKHLYRIKLISGNYSFINILPWGHITQEVTEGLAFDRPLILDHNPIMEMPSGFELKEGVHFLSLMGNTLLPTVLNNLYEHPILESTIALTLKDIRSRSLELVEKVQNKDLYAGIKANVMDYRAKCLNAENLCKMLEFYRDSAAS